MEEAAPTPGMQPWEAGAASTDAFSLSQNHRKLWVEKSLKEHLVPAPTQGTGCCRALYLLFSLSTGFPFPLPVF